MHLTLQADFQGPNKPKAGRSDRAGHTYATRPWLACLLFPSFVPLPNHRRSGFAHF